MSRSTHANIDATAFGGIYYDRPMVALKQLAADLSMREQLDDLTDASMLPEPISFGGRVRDEYTEDIVRSGYGTERFVTESRGYRYSPLFVEWMNVRTVQPVRIEHAIPRKQRVLKQGPPQHAPVWDAVRECEAEYGPDHEITQSVREEARTARTNALKRESVTRFGYLPTLGR